VWIELALNTNQRQRLVNTVMKQHVPNKKWNVASSGTVSFTTRILFHRVSKANQSVHDKTNCAFCHVPDNAADRGVLCDKPALVRDTIKRTLSILPATKLKIYKRGNENIQTTGSRICPGI
jgi:hypothetical protein